MPSYDYKCKSCGHTWEEHQSVNARNVPRYNPCPNCNESGSMTIILGTRGFSDPVQIGIRKPDRDVVNRLNEIKKNYGEHAGADLKNFSG